MNMLRSFFRRITNDLQQKKLIPLKVLFFVHASTLFVLYPYLTIHMRELGINVEETAIMSAVTPVISIIMPPLAGMLADKIGNFKLLLALSSALGGASALLLLAVPVGRITVTFPPAVELITTCNGGLMHLRQVKEYPCRPLHSYEQGINLTVLSCGFVCGLPGDLTSEESDQILLTNSYNIELKSNEDHRRHIYSRFPLLHVNSVPIATKDQSTSRTLKNNPLFNVTISTVISNEIFFPAPDLYELKCSEGVNITSCNFGLNDGRSYMDVFNINKEAKYRANISLDSQLDSVYGKNYWITAISHDNKTNWLKKDNGVDGITCNDNFITMADGGVPIRVGSNPQRRMLNCTAACASIAPRKSLCENQKQHIELDPAFTFWAYLAVRVFIGIIGGTAFAMFEGAVIAIVREQRADYGLQRVYGSIGGMISSPLSGLLIDYASRGKGYTDFRPAFYLYAVLKVASGVLMLSIDLEFKQPAQNLLEDVISVFKNIEIVALFIACFIMGTAWGYIESFLFWLLQDLGASRSLMGVTITVGGIAGLPLLVLSGPIIRRLGHANVLFIGFVFYAIRLLGYSLIYNPWLCLIFEALESVTSSLSFTAAVTYAARLSSTTTDTSVQGLLGGLYYGVGKGSGSLIGGYLMKFFGTRPTYQIFAGATLFTGCIYYLFNKFYIGKRAIGDENDICKKKPPLTDVESIETKETSKANAIDVAGSESKLHRDSQKSKVVPENKEKLILDNTDGSSDSGVDNPAYNDTESTISDTKKV